MSVVLNNISKIYGNQKALDNIEFSANKGEIIGLLGPNGAGKTTTMKILTCYIPPTEGDAKVCDFSVLEEPMQVRQCIGYLPEHNPLYKEMYVREYLRTVARIFKISNPTKKVDELIELTGLTKESSKRIEFLSKGYRQRVGLAQAMMNDPEVLILDEPTSGLDPNQLVDIRALIKKLGEEKLVIFSSHIMQEVESLCDRVIILNDGKLVADDSMSTLMAQSRGTKVVKVIFKGDMDMGKIQNLEYVTDVKKIGLEYHINMERDVDIRENIFDLAVQDNNKILQMVLDETSIEAVFQSITN